MVCFDYEEVECEICGKKTADGYTEIDEKIICDKCLKNGKDNSRKTRTTAC